MAEPWSKFFWSDWEADQGLRLCSLAAQGLWMRMLCVCAKSDTKGFLAINGNQLGPEDVAKLCAISPGEAEVLMEELSRNGVFSRDRRGWIYSRRMTREVKKSATGKKFANKRWSQADDNTGEKTLPNGYPNGPPTTHIPEARSQKEDSEAKASAADGGAGPPADEDFAKQLFDRGVQFLGKHGTPETKARRMIGLWRKDHPDPEIFDAFSACSRAGAVDPIPWITARLGGAKVDIRAMMKEIGNA